ncbi:MAG: copper amine oxidase N-terminal domain-containing protein [Lachnospirales bacterium]
MKKRLSVFLAACLAIGAISVPVCAEESVNSEINIVVSGSAITCDQPPVIVSDRVLIPLRAVGEAVGADVNWNGEEKSIAVTKGDKVITCKIGDMFLTSDNTNIDLDVPAQIINERTMVPLRAIAEAFDLNVEWDSNSKTVAINYNVQIEENIAEDATVEVTTELSEEVSNLVVEETVEATTEVSKKVITTKDSDYSNKYTGKITIEDSVEVNDYTVFTATATYDTISGNDSYNEFAKNMAESIIAKNIAEVGAKRKADFLKLDEDKISSFEKYRSETTIEAVYSSDVVVSTKITTKFFQNSLNYNTEVTTILTDKTGANSVNVSDITNNKYTDDDVYKVGMEKLNVLIDNDKADYYNKKVKNGGLTQDMLNIYIDQNGNFVVYAKRGVLAKSTVGEVAVVITNSDLEKSKR